MDAVALASVVSSAAVGVAGALVPAWVRHRDRVADREAMLRERRSVAYGALLRLLREGATLDPSEQSRRIGEVSEQVWLWGSAEVRHLTGVWAEALPGVYGPDVSDEARRREQEAANAARQQMADELQARVRLR